MTTITVRVKNKESQQYVLENEEEADEVYVGYHEQLGEYLKTLTIGFKQVDVFENGRVTIR